MTDYGKVVDGNIVHADGCAWNNKGRCTCGMDAAYDLGRLNAMLKLVGEYEEQIDKKQAEAWQKCVDWMAYQGQADVKHWVLELAEQNNPYVRPGESDG